MFLNIENYYVSKIQSFNGKFNVFTKLLTKYNFTDLLHGETFKYMFKTITFLKCILFLFFCVLITISSFLLKEKSILPVHDTNTAQK